jgi:hypothetical protein
VTTRTVFLLATALTLLRNADLLGQSRGRDLPVALRSLAGVTLNRDSAASIRAKLGNTREERVGTGHGVDVVWCYAPAGTTSGPLLELMSDASDMGTPGHSLDVIRLRASAPAKDMRGCAPLSRTVQLATPAGLQLGSTLLKVQELLGPPTRRDADSVIYAFSAKEYMQPGTPEYQTWNTPENRESCFDAGLPYANVTARLVVLFRDNRAIEIRLERYDQAVC